MRSSLQFPGFALPVYPSKSGTKAKADSTPSLSRPLTKDVFFSGRSGEPNVKTKNLYQIVKTSKHGLNPEEMHEMVIELLSQGADPHYVDQDGKTAAEHLEKLKLYTDAQYDEAQRQYGQILNCGYNFEFEISNYVSKPEAKPLQDTIDVLRGWAVNEGAALRDDAASNYSEDTPLLKKRQPNHSTFRN